MPNLDIDQYPDGLIQLYRFDQDVEDFYLDIEFIGVEDDNLAMLVPEYFNQFAAFAIDGTGSVMAFWFYNNERSIEEAPIVYLDSEGGGTVVATTAQEFLSLLPYNTSFFSEAASHWVEWKEHPEITVPPASHYTQEYYHSQLEYFTEAYPSYTDFRSWLRKEMKIQPDENPFGTIVKNIEHYPTLPIEG